MANKVILASICLILSFSPLLGGCVPPTQATVHTDNSTSIFPSPTNVVTDNSPVEQNDSVASDNKSGISNNNLASSKATATNTKTDTYILVAAPDAPDRIKAQADYLVPGSGWEPQVQKYITDSAHGKVSFIGTFSKSTIAPLLISSDTQIDIPVGSIFKFANNVGDGATMFANQDDADTNIIIFGGGILDGNSGNQSIGLQSAISFMGVTNSNVDILMSNFTGRPVSDDGDNNVIVNELYPNATKTNVDLVKLMTGSPNVAVVDQLENNGLWTLGSGAHWSGDDAYSGNFSVRMAIPGVSGVSIRRDFSPALDLSNSSFGIWYKYDAVASNTGFVIEYTMYAPDAKNSWTNRVEYRDTSTTSNEWTYGGIMPGGKYVVRTVGKPDIKNVTRVFIKIYSAKSGFDVYVDALTKVTDLLPHGAIVMSFDGPYRSQYDNAFPILQSYNVKGVIYCVTNWVNSDNATYLSTEELTALQNAGWDISSHGMQMADLATTNPGEIERIVAGSKDWLIRNGFGKGARFFSNPFGDVSAISAQIIGDYFLINRGIVEKTPNTGLPLFDPMSVESIPDKSDLTAAEADVDDIYNTGGLGVFYYHNIRTPAQPGELNTADFKALVAYIVKKGIPIVTMSDIVDKYLNPDQNP